MRYRLEDIEDQIQRTLSELPILQGTTIKPHAGEVNVQTFMYAEKMEGFITLLPLIMYQYQGKKRVITDSTKKMNVHELRFRFFVGAESLRELDEAKRNAYELLRIVYDAVHGVYPNTDQPLDRTTFKTLSGSPLFGVNCISPFMEVEGDDERLVVNLPHIVVYQTDYVIRIVA